MRRTWMAAAGMALVAVMVAVAQIPSDVYTVDVRTTGKQFALTGKLRTSPCWVFSLTQGGTAWDATGYTATLRWSASESSEAMGSLPGIVSGSTVTVQAGTNDLRTAVTRGYCRLTVEKAGEYRAYAEGTMDLQDGREIP